MYLFCAEKEQRHYLAVIAAAQHNMKAATMVGGYDSMKATLPIWFTVLAVLVGATLMLIQMVLVFVLQCG